MQKMANEFEAAVGGIVAAAVAGDFGKRVDLHGKSGLVPNVGTVINSLCENVANDLLALDHASPLPDVTECITESISGQSYPSIKKSEP